MAYNPNVPEQSQLTLPIDEFQLRNQRQGFQMKLDLDYPIQPKSYDEFVIGYESGVIRTGIIK